MNYILLGLSSVIASIVLLLWFNTFPAGAAVFPKLVTYSCFLLPGIASLITGYRNKDHKKFSGTNIRKWIDSYKSNIGTKAFRGVWFLFILTILFVVGMAQIGFFPSAIIYSLVILLGIYRMPIKGTIIYTTCSVAFLYVFFALIFKVKV